jgi:hypothetical protein
MDFDDAALLFRRQRLVDLGHLAVDREALLGDALAGQRLRQGQRLGVGRRVEVEGIWIHRLEAGRIVEGREWGQSDWLGLLQQMSAAPGGTASADQSTSA